MGRLTERLYNGVVKENPTFVMMLGMCIDLVQYADISTAEDHSG